jgi:pimeloyl-ACP methyl ester carboxylesterase
MKRFGLWVLMVSVLVWGLNFAPALAADCEEGELATGALYRICLPDSWNGRLLVYAPGYVSPLKDLAIPEDQLVLPDGTSIPELVTGLGYAFAVTSFRDNGLVVLAGLADLEALVEKFKADDRDPSRVYLVGVSQGGLMATLAAEGRASGFDGALPCCAAIGDFPGRSITGGTCGWSLIISSRGCCRRVRWLSLRNYKKIGMGATATWNE